MARWGWMACGWGLVLGAAAMASVALNIWNIAIIASALQEGNSSSHHDIDHHRYCRPPLVQAFLIGSLVSSALTLLSCGITVPIPSLVFAILGSVWRDEPSLSACNHFTHDTIDRSLAVLWYTFASGSLFTFILFCAPFGITLGILSSADEQSS